MLFIVTIQPWSLATMYGFNTPYHLKSNNSICIFRDTLNNQIKESVAKEVFFTELKVSVA